MADAYQTRAQLVTDFADNTSGAITAQLLRDLLYSTVILNSAGLVDVGAATVFKLPCNLDLNGHNLLNGATLSADTGNITSDGSGNLTAVSFVGALSGNATTASSSSAAAVVVHPNGTSTTYLAASNTDAAAGTAVMAAKAAATSGDTIQVYRNAIVTSTLAKDGVNWNFAPGVIISSSTAGLLLFGDNGGGSAMSYTVSGQGIFRLSGNDAMVYTLKNAGSTVNFDFEEATSTGGATITGAAAVYSSAGNGYLRGNLINGSNTGYGVWWDDGNLYVEAQKVTCGTAGVAVYTQPLVGATAGQLWLTCQHIKGSQPILIQKNAGDGARVWIQTELIESVGSTAVPAILLDGGDGTGIFAYLLFQKLLVGADRGNAPAIEISAVSAYITCDKITPNVDAGHDTAAVLITGTTPSAWLDIRQIDDSKGQIASGGGAAIRQASGTSYVRLMSCALANNGDAIQVSGGTMNLHEGTISTQSAQHDLNQSGGTLNVYPDVNFTFSKTTGTLKAAGSGSGFNGVTMIAKPTVTGSRGSNAALASLLTALANLGLVTDGSS